MRIFINSHVDYLSLHYVESSFIYLRFEAFQHNAVLDSFTGTSEHGKWFELYRKTEDKSVKYLHSEIISISYMTCKL